MESVQAGRYGQGGHIPSTTDKRAARCNAQLSPIEREQIRAFNAMLSGRRGCWLALRLLAAVNLCGVILHLVLPQIGWGAAILAANVLGAGLGFGMLLAMFYYRLMMRHKGLVLGGVFGFGLAGNLTGSTARLLAGGLPLDALPGALLGDLPRIVGVSSGLVLLVALPMLVVGALRARQYEALAAGFQLEAERERLARELAEAQLRLLHAQIEPHFLFNTLGAVQQLAQHEAPRAAELTADLIAFLRASLGEMRRDRVTLAEEFALAASYLKVMQARLGRRLRFSLQLPAALEQVHIPGMIVLTLVENAVKHGIEPALRGGAIDVAAACADGVLRITVSDDGAGLGAAADADKSEPGGSGLDNIRRRLRLAYGDAAGLALRAADAGGVVAELTLPA